jgi:small subunit ribosomal protein S1
MSTYKPEGMWADTLANRQSFRSVSALQEAFAAGKILESRAIVCDAQHNLIVDMGAFRGIIPREEGALGIADGNHRDIAIISKVNKPVCYKLQS